MDSDCNLTLVLLILHTIDGLVLIIIVYVAF